MVRGGWRGAAAAATLLLTPGFPHAEDVGVLVGVPVQQLRSVLAEVDLEAPDSEVRIAARLRWREGRGAADAEHR